MPSMAAFLNNALVEFIKLTPTFSTANVHILHLFMFIVL